MGYHTPTRFSLQLFAVVSLLVSLVLAWLIWHQWHQVERAQPSEDTVIVLGQDQLNEFVERQFKQGTAAQFQNSAGLFKIPTGVFIQSMVFASSSNVNLTGYIWQVYPVDFPYERGFSFPEQISSGDTVIELQYCFGLDQSREQKSEDIRENKILPNECRELVAGTMEHGALSSGGDENTSHLIGWYFDVTLRQSFDYKKYPMDFLTIWLRIWPKEIAYDQFILPVPDFAAYSAGGDLQDTEDERFVYPAAFGLDRGFVQGEWEIDTSYFSYREIEYDTNFGFHSGLEVERKPISETEFSVSRYQELHFNLGVKRKFLSAFIKNLVPLLVVGLLLFSTVMTITADKEQSSRFGYSTSGLLGTCSALFFVVMLSHIQVRSMFAGSGLVYIEYFYLVMYLYILLTALNGYLFSLIGLEKFRLLQYGDNLVAKVTFWPVLLFGMLVVGWYVL